jgi:hypothetical protein
LNVIPVKTGIQRFLSPESLRVLDGSVLDEIKKSGFLEKVKG